MFAAFKSFNCLKSSNISNPDSVLNLSTLDKEKGQYIINVLSLNLLPVKVSWNLLFTIGGVDHTCGFSDKHLSIEFLLKNSTFVKIVWKLVSSFGI